MDVVDRINCCGSFAEGHCPHQAQTERVYLIYQIFETEGLLRAKASCVQRENGPATSRLRDGGPPHKLRCGSA